MTEVHSGRNFNVYESESDSKEELTSVTGNFISERAGSLIEDDVDSMKIDNKFSSNRIISGLKPKRVYEANYETSRNREIDEYDLEKLDYMNTEHLSEQSNEEELNTVVPMHRNIANVSITRHNNNTSTQYTNRTNDENRDERTPSETSVDIGRQINQLAHRIESLGNISRIYDDELLHHQNHLPCTGATECCIPGPMMCRPGCYGSPCGLLPEHDHLSLENSRKLDNLQRLQKRQEDMQNRLVTLAQKLNDSTTNLLERTSPVPQQQKNPIKSTKVIRKEFKKSSKRKKSKERKSTKLASASFLSSILNDINANEKQEPVYHQDEQPLISSSYYVAANDANSVASSAANKLIEANNKFFTNELNDIRLEFRTQVEEIRRLLSERYQNETEARIEDFQRKEHQLELTKELEAMRKSASPCLKPLNNVCDDKHCPLDKYLERSVHTKHLPHLDSQDADCCVTSLRAGILPSVAKALRSKHRMLSDPIEAERFLVELSSRRANLENNICTLERCKESEFLFNILHKLQSNEKDVEAARIQALVDDAICSCSADIQNQVNYEHKLWLERRSRQQLQQQQSQLEDTHKLLHKDQHQPRPTKVLHHINYDAMSHLNQPTTKPIKKYAGVASRIDSGVRKSMPAVRPANLSAKKNETVSNQQQPQQLHPSWANRRRYRKPYLHFVNDIKLAKKPIGPLGDASLNQYRDKSPRRSSRRRHKSSEEELEYQTVDYDEITPMRFKQYSLDYDELNPDRTEPRAVPPTTASNDAAVAPSRIQENIAQCIDSMSNDFCCKMTTPSDHLKSINNCNAKQPTNDIAVQVMSKPSEIIIPNSPTYSESGKGFKLNAVCKTRVKHFEPVDPLEPKIRDVKIKDYPKVGPDTNNLRYLIEREIWNQMEPPDDDSSRSESRSERTITHRDGISTPRFTPRSMTPQSPTKTIDDGTLTFTEDLKTPTASIYDRNTHNTRVSTPSIAESIEARTPRRTGPIEVQPIAIQTMVDQSAQTIANQSAQTSPQHTLQRPPITSHSPSSDIPELHSLTGTPPNSFSEGMWLLDRSLGQVADHPIEPLDRWQIGWCPDEPNWPEGTRYLAETDGESSLSLGEFTKPTLPGLRPTQDAVLQVMQLPSAYHTSNNPDTDDMQPFKSMGISRTPPHPYQQAQSPVFSSGHSSLQRYKHPKSIPQPAMVNSGEEGEINLPLDDEDSFPVSSGEIPKSPQQHNPRKDSPDQILYGSTNYRASQSPEINTNELIKGLFNTTSNNYDSDKSHDYPYKQALENKAPIINNQLNIGDYKDDFEIDEDDDIEQIRLE